MGNNPNQSREPSLSRYQYDSNLHTGLIRIGAGFLKAHWSSMEDPYEFKIPSWIGYEKFGSKNAYSETAIAFEQNRIR
jgi:hypothetical protein